MNTFMGWSWHWRVDAVPDGYEWKVFKLYGDGREDITYRGTAATKSAADSIAQQTHATCVRGEM